MLAKENENVNAVEKLFAPSFQRAPSLVPSAQTFVTIVTSTVRNVTSEDTVANLVNFVHIVMSIALLIRSRRCQKNLPVVNFSKIIKVIVIS